MEPSTWVIAVAVGAVVTFFIFYFFFTYTFSMRRQLWNQKKQITLLIMIAKKLGCTGEELETIDVRNNQETDRYLDHEVK